MTKISSTSLHLYFKITSLIFYGFLCSCESTIEKIHDVSSKDFDLPYDLQKPQQKNYLEHSLQEISALSFSANGQDLFCLNDEEGKTFLIEGISSDILEMLPFGKKGDYEGIEIVNGDLYVLKSSGTLYLIDLNKQEIDKKYKSDLSKKNDVEGLGFDHVDSTLLLACKAQAGMDEPIMDARAVYAFDLKKKELISEPYLLITDEMIEDFLISNGPKIGDNLKEKAFVTNLFKRASYFAPSGIAVHPKTGHYYIISAVAKLLIVMDRNKKILNISFLDSSIFSQPEGICFSNKGVLYIANEGVKSKASVCIFGDKIRKSSNQEEDFWIVQ